VHVKQLSLLEEHTHVKQLSLLNTIMRNSSAYSRKNKKIIPL
jgi:hypothetical protein